MASSTYEEPENLKARIKASYDVIAPAYNAWTISHSPLRLAYLDQLIALLRPASMSPESLPLLRILELGCGAGQPVTAKLLTALAPVHVTANDISTSQLNLAKESLGEHGEILVANGGSNTNASTASSATVDWVEDDMMALSFPDGSLDAVLGFYSVIHLPVAEQAEIINRIARWLKPGSGYFLANFAEKAMPGLVMEKWLHEKGWMFWSGWGVEATETKLREAGLELVTSKVEEDDVKDARFHWVIASKPAVA